MSANPNRRLRRQALHDAGWRTDRPRSGRRRGSQRQDALREVGVVFGVFKSRQKAPG